MKSAQRTGPVMPAKVKKGERWPKGYESQAARDWRQLAIHEYYDHLADGTCGPDTGKGIGMPDGSSDYCGYCTRARALIKKHPLPAPSSKSKKGKRP